MNDMNPAMEKLKSASELLGIALLDHIIVGETGYESFLDTGLLGR